MGLSGGWKHGDADFLAQHVRRPQSTVFVQSEGLVTACHDCEVCLNVLRCWHMAGWEVALELLREVWLEGGSPGIPRVDCE